MTGFPPAAGGPPVSAAVLNPLVPDRAAEALDKALRGELRDVRGLDVRSLGEKWHGRPRRRS